MPNTQQVALVTGANRGIGFEAVRQLAEHGLHVVLSSRNIEQGQRATEQFVRRGLSVSYQQLDVTDGGSIIQSVKQIQQQRGGIDVLVNNAGVYLDEGVSVFSVDEATVRATIESNFHGPFALTRAVVPLMRARGYGRVVNVSSGYGSMVSMGGYTGAYRISKIALNAFTRIAADELRHENIKINAMDLGWVRTDMGGSSAPRSPEQAVDTLVWLATLPDDGPTGGFFYDRKQQQW